jgi:hypothetical protein
MSYPLPDPKKAFELPIRMESVMKHKMIRAFKFALSIVGLLVVTLGQASAGPITIVPTELSPGDSYRLAFLTSDTIVATSDDINVYNTFVDDLGDIVITSDWRAIASTPTVHARDNTGTNPDDSTGVPIFLLNNTRLANDNAHLWNSNVNRLQALAITNTGGSAGDFEFLYVWTGTQSDGTTTDALGSLMGRVGKAQQTSSAWIDNGKLPKDELRPLYAMSGELEVPAAQPAGYSIVRGSDQVTSTNITGHPGMVVFDTGQTNSVCQSFVLSKPSRQMVRIFIVPDNWVSQGYEDLGDYIQNVPGANGHDYGILWVGPNLDHDGNTGEGASTHWIPRGFSGHDVNNASGNIVKFGVDPSTGNFSWWDPDGVGKWRQGSPVPSEHTPYIAFANSQVDEAKPIPSVTFDDAGCDNPTALCQYVTVQLDASGNASIVPSDVDDGSTAPYGNLALSVAPNAFTCNDVGQKTVILTVTDGNNSDTCLAMVTVKDNSFIRGNINARSTKVLDLADVVDLATHLFGGLDLSYACDAAIDVNNDGSLNITDLVTLVYGIYNSSLITIPPPNSTNPGLNIAGVVVSDGGSIPSVLGCADGESCTP